MEDLRL